MHKQIKERDILNVKQLAVYLNVSESLIYRLVNDGGFPHIRLGKRILFKKSSVDLYILKLEK